MLPMGLGKIFTLTVYYDQHMLVTPSKIRSSMSQYFKSRSQVLCVHHLGGAWPAFVDEIAETVLVGAPRVLQASYLLHFEPSSFLFQPFFPPFSPPSILPVLRGSEKHCF